MTKNQGCDLYRLLGEGGELLYVGISLNVAKRMSEHRKDKSWWDEVTDIKRTQYSSKHEALKAERQAIKRDRPKYNVQYNILNMACRHCGRHVGSDGYVYLNGDSYKFRREYNARMEEIKRRPENYGLALICLADLDGLPNEPSWILTHARCDNDSADYYNIDAPRISTWRDVAHWSAHLSQKNWFTDTDWAGFVYWLERHNGGLRLP